MGWWSFAFSAGMPVAWRRLVRRVLRVARGGAARRHDPAHAVEEGAGASRRGRFLLGRIGVEQRMDMIERFLEMSEPRHHRPEARRLLARAGDLDPGGVE